MRPREAGGLEPDEAEQAELIELWHLSTMGTNKEGPVRGRTDRLAWVVDAFLNTRPESFTGRKWIYVWLEANTHIVAPGVYEAHLPASATAELGPQTVSIPEGEFHEIRTVRKPLTQAQVDAIAATHAPAAAALVMADKMQGQIDELQGLLDDQKVLIARLVTLLQEANDVAGRASATASRKTFDDWQVLRRQIEQVMNELAGKQHG